MWTVINGIDRTGVIPPESIKLDQTLSDPMSQAALDVNDAGSKLNIKTLQDIVILDETSSVQNPTWNLLLGPSLLNTDTGHYYDTNSGSGPIASFVGNSVHVVFSNNASGTYGFKNQQLQLGLITPGQIYTLSLYMQGSGALTGMANAAFLSFTFLDAGGNNLAGFNTQQTPTTTQVRMAVSGQAPAGAVTALVTFGGESFSTTNSGTLIYTTAQFEPNWFAAEGVSYPTPDCNPAQTSGPNISYQMPDGTTIRGTRLFAGQVQQSHRIYDDESGGTGAAKDRTHQLTCVSAEWMLETTILINKSYSNIYDDQILVDIVSSTLYRPPTGTGQVSNVPLLSTNNVIRGRLIDQISFDGMTVREALNALCNLSNFSFYVDPYLDMHYTPPFYGTTWFGLSDTPDTLTTFAYQELEVDDDGSQVRTRVQVNGGNYSVGVQPPQAFNGDGVTTVFTLNFQPDAILSITVGGVAQNVKPTGQGTLGVSGLQVQWDKTTPKITFNTAPPAGVNNVVVNYTYPSPVRVRAWEMRAISAQNGRTYDAKIEDSSLTTPTAAASRAEAETAQYASPLSVYKFKTLQAVQPGNVVPFTCQTENLASFPLLLQKVTTTTPQGAGLYVYEVEAGAYQPRLIDLVANTHKAVNRSNKTAVLPLVQEYLSFRDTLTYTESPISIHT